MLETIARLFKREGKDIRKKIKQLGYHAFIGRQVFSDGTEFYVTIDTRVTNTFSTPIPHLVNDLCRIVKEGKKVLLTGQLKGEDRIKAWLDVYFAKRYGVSSCYMPLRPDEMANVRADYEARLYMDMYFNPFEYQESTRLRKTA